MNGPLLIIGGVLGGGFLYGMWCSPIKPCLLRWQEKWRLRRLRRAYEQAERDAAEVEQRAIEGVARWIEGMLDELLEIRNLPEFHGDRRLA